MVSMDRPTVREQLVTSPEVCVRGGGCKNDTKFQVISDTVERYDVIFM